jgi:hypothetical protein
MSKRAGTSSKTTMDLGRWQGPEKAITMPIPKDRNKRKTVAQALSNTWENLVYYKQVPNIRGNN